MEKIIIPTWDDLRLYYLTEIELLDLNEGTKNKIIDYIIRLKISDKDKIGFYENIVTILKGLIQNHFDFKKASIEEIHEHYNKYYYELESENENINGVDVMEKAVQLTIQYFSFYLNEKEGFEKHLEKVKENHKNFIQNLKELAKDNHNMIEKINNVCDNEKTCDKIKKHIKLEENTIKMLEKTIDEIKEKANDREEESLSINIIKDNIKTHQETLDYLKDTLNREKYYENKRNDSLINCKEEEITPISEVEMFKRGNNAGEVLNSLREKGTKKFDFNEFKTNYNLVDSKNNEIIHSEENKNTNELLSRFSSAMSEVNKYTYLRCNNFKVNFFGIPSCLVESFESGIGNIIRIVFKETKEFSVEKYLRDNNFFKRYNESFTVEYLDSALKKVRVDTYNMRDVNNVIFECKDKNYADDSILTISINFQISDPKDHTITLLDQHRKE